MNKLMELRKAKKLTQTALARQIGVTAGFIWQLENNFSSPSVETLQKLARALNCTVDELIGGDEEGGET